MAMEGAVSEDVLVECEAFRDPVAESSRLEESLLHDESYSRFESSTEALYNDGRPGTNSGGHSQSRDSRSRSHTPDHAKEQEDPKKDEQTEMQELAQLSTEELMEKLDNLKTIAYSLGQSEAHEMTRGKLLNVFGMNNVRR